MTEPKEKDDPSLQIWQSQPVEAPRMSPEYLKHLVEKLTAADRFEHYMTYIGTIVLATILLLVLFWRPRVPPHLWSMLRLGASLGFLGACYGVFQMRRGRRILRGQPDENVVETLALLRTELQRRRHYCLNRWRWSVLPMVPAAAVLLIGGMFLDPRPGRPVLYGIGLLFFVASMLLIVWNDRRKARKYQREQDLLGTLR